MDILSELNPSQREAAEHPGGPLLILAGPGSGKTRVITHRIAYLVQEQGVPPSRILAVTFTNKAAREMKERLRALIGSPSTPLGTSVADQVTMGTFHAVCVRILRAEAAHHGLDPRFVIYDDDDQVTLLKRCLQELGVDTKRYTPRAVLSAIGAAKSQLIAAEDYPAHSYFEEVVRRAYDLYQRELAEAKALDFDDLIMRTVQLFRDVPEVLERYQSRYLHLLIDEFQDTNVAQYVWARLLAARHRNICVVGDPDQSIYSWRSADIRNILNFEQDYKDAKAVYLEQNYRSTKTILEAARHVIAANRQRKEVQLWTQNQAGVPITYREGYDEDEEAWYVVQELERQVVRGPYHFGDCAVMYRTNAQSRALEEAMVRHGLPYKLVGATRFYERREIKDLVAYLRLAQNPYDSVSLQRVINVPGRGIGQRTVEELSRWASRLGVPLYSALQLAVATDDERLDQPRPQFSPKITSALSGFLALLNELILAAGSDYVADLFDLLLERLDYRKYLTSALEDGEERWENVQELRAVAEQFTDLKPPAGLEALLENIALVSDVDSLAEQTDAVTLITLHQAKGLEFPVVFIVGMEEGIFPHIRSFDDPNQMEEERRLAYVGITRAKERLYLMRAFRRNTMGSRVPSPASRFLRDIPAHLMVASQRTSGEAAADRREVGPERSRVPVGAPAGAATQQRPLEEMPYRTGDHVRHAQFGEGIVVSCEAGRQDQIVTVAFKGSAGIKRLSLAYAPLEKLS
ncbi:MAG: UvrD-helicase domain-containing protein [Chloroflexi bacterium]|nr:UvrD-helicase domain-containing protein [Chloroflexota bacterium]